MSVLGASRVAMNPDSASTVATQSQNSVLSQVATYIPSEVVATYVALQGIFSTGSEFTKWVLFGVGVALCVVLPVLNFITTKNAVAPAADAAGAADSGSKQVTVIIMAIVAFTAYAMALPGTVFENLFKSASLVGAAAALVLAVLMPAIANAFKIKISS